MAVEQPRERLPGSRRRRRRSEEVARERRARRASAPTRGGTGRRSTGSSRWRTAITSPSSRVRRRLEHVGQRASPRASGSGPAVERLRQPGEEAASRRGAPGSPCRARARARSRPRRRRPRRSPGGRGRRRASASSAASRAHDLRRRARVRRAGRARARRRGARARAAPPRRRDLVVPPHHDLRPERPEQVREVVGERVVVVDQEDHHASAPTLPGRSRPRARAACRRHSSCSAAGSESATIPPPACRCATPSRRTSVRIAMHVSSSRRSGQAVADGARVDAAPVALELRDDLHRPHLRRARDRAGREASRAAARTASTPSRSSPDDLRDEVRHVRVALGLHEALDPHRARHADAGEVVAAEVDEHRVLGAVLLRGEQRARRRPPRARSCPAIGLSVGAAALALDERLRRAADEREVAELEQEEVRRRVDAAQRPVELDRRGRRRPRRALRDHDLEDVALADVLLRALDAAQVLVPRRAPRSSGPRVPVPRGTPGCGRVEQRRGLAGSPQHLGDAARRGRSGGAMSGTTKRLSGSAGPVARAAARSARSVATAS